MHLTKVKAGVQPAAYSGGRGGTRTLKAFRPADFKSTAYTNSATRPNFYQYT